MINQKIGKIINISSVWGLAGASCEVHYSASKAGIIGLTKALAKELAPSNICVNAVSPGVIKTEMCNFDDETMNLIKEDIPLGRIGTPMDVANTVDFLSGNLSDYITGEIINVSGGYLI
jgi:3-oxoacyl-[acyl-carrier protein] reductase